jgi:type I site-specific restriction endonuclease
VDLLTTGVDIPDLEFLVFLRPIKSRILFTQMLGRGTRLGERFPDKSHFTVFDCFDGTLFEYFRKTSDETSDYPAPPSRPTLRRATNFSSKPRPFSSTPRRVCRSFSARAFTYNSRAYSNGPPPCSGCIATAK